MTITATDPFARGRAIGAVAAVALVATVLAANWAIERFGFWPVGFGLSAPAGVYFAGLAFGLRDVVHVTLGRLAVFGCILAGGLLSWTVSPAFAAASSAAFMVSELADLFVYERFRERQWMTAAAASNVVGAAVDSALFLWIAFGSLNYFAGQVVGKIWAGALGVAMVAGTRRLMARRREAVAA